MLDVDLAAIYGYTAKAFNQQVSRNADRFEGEDFMFQLTQDEWTAILRSQIVTSSWGGRRYLPYAFTEQGIYMLMTVLRGELAVKQSRMLIRLFKRMKDVFAEGRAGVLELELWKLKAQVSEHSVALSRLDTLEQSMLTRADLPAFMHLFDREVQADEVLILDGEPLKADIAYQEIYGSAKKSIVVMDDYIGVKTLQHLAHAPAGVEITIIGDNRAKPSLTAGEFRDFLAENPEYEIAFVQSGGRSHDRFIWVDGGTLDERLYHCGASSKDAGKRITAIARLQEITPFVEMMQNLMNGPELILAS